MACNLVGHSKMKPIDVDELSKKKIQQLIGFNFKGKLNN